MTVETEDLSTLRFVAGVVRQAGALAWQTGPEGWQCMLVTSRRTGRWVLPKGSIEPGMDERGTAVQELFEEAGVIGRAGPDPFGSILLPKIRPPLLWTVEAVIYPVEIDRILDDWQESGQRERRLVGCDEALDLLASPDMGEIVRRAAGRLAG